jgi:ankyrin repeat protein
VQSTNSAIRLQVNGPPLDAGTDPNAKNKGGETPLHWAAKNSHQEAMDQIIKGGADANAEDNYGTTPTYVVERGDKK